MSRIIAGSRRGMRLAMPEGDRTRPTSDRVRESAFTLIAGWAGTAGEPAITQLDRFTFLDLFAGSGAVALEAASRGAGGVHAVEKDAATAALIRRNAEALSLDVTAHTASVASYLAGPPTRFDVVWLDPPYSVPSDEVAGIVARVVEGEWLAEDGLVVVERSSRDEPPVFPDALGERWSRRYGETTLYLATKEDA